MLQVLLAGQVEVLAEVGVQGEHVGQVGLGQGAHAQPVELWTVGRWVRMG